MNRVFPRLLKVRVSGQVGAGGCGRCLSTTSVFRDDGTKSKSTTNYLPNSELTPCMVNNRNPRNLEKLRIAEKVCGWDLDIQDRSFWNKLSIELTGKHISAKILHVLGRVPVSASTNEWCIKKFLYSTKDAIAAKTVGQVLAHRCLQMGITEIACFISQEDRQKEKVALILQALEDGGVALEEPDQVEYARPLNHFALPDKSWEVIEDFDDQLDAANTLVQVTKNKKSKK